MAPKKRRQNTSVLSGGGCNSVIFLSQEAEEYYKTNIIKRPLIPERGMQESTITDPTRGKIVESRRWAIFMRKPDSAAKGIVREFYANAKYNNGETVKVRGQSVCYSRKTINQLFQLEDIDGDNEFEVFREIDLDLDIIGQKICGRKVEWNYGLRDQPKSFRSSLLTPQNRQWFSFICGRMLPCTHVSDVSYERAVLIFAIHEGIPIDIGKMISDGIRRAISSRDGLPFPHLITTLCKNAGVELDPMEDMMQPKPTIIAVPMASTNAELPDEGQLLRALYSTSTTGRIKRLEEYISHTVEYNCAWKSALFKWFELLGARLNIPTEQFPQLPSLPRNPFGTGIRGNGARGAHPSDGDITVGGSSERAAVMSDDN